MLKHSQYWVLSTLGALCALLVLVNIVLFTSNRALQSEVNGRAQYIQQSVQLQNLYQQMVRAIADLSVRNQDEQLKAVLARQGINVTAKAAAAGSTGAPGDKPATRPRGEAHHE
ncbi:MAG TPA: hypothetical protein VMU40_04020 [Steroidobacteraceae bacterium]|nr:hypothetical protein [Steroidobacteraceae bacterium]